jgi:hypothetical protein
MKKYNLVLSFLFIVLLANSHSQMKLSTENADFILKMNCKVDTLRNSLNKISLENGILKNKILILEERYSSKKNDIISYSILGTFVSILIALIVFLVKHFYEMSKDLKSDSERRTIDIDVLAKKQQKILNNLYNYFDFFIIQFNQILDENKKLKVDEVRYLVELEYNENDLRGNAILWFLNFGRKNVIPYLEQIKIIDEHYKDFAQEAIDKIKERNV